MSHTHDTLTEIHNHLLPNVDDGSRSMDETIRYLRAFAADGVGTLAFSPHLFGYLSEEPDGLERRVDKLRRVFDDVVARCDGRADVPALQLGFEVLLTDPIMARRVLAHPDVRHGRSDTVLIEFGFDLPEQGCLEIIRAAGDAGRRPIVAHPERYRRRNGAVPIDEIHAWRDAGALLQINGGSITGYYSREVHDLAWTLLHEGLAHIIGSDNHADSRPQTPGEVLRMLREHGAHEQGRLLLVENPRRALASEPLLDVPTLSRLQPQS